MDPDRPIQVTRAVTLLWINLGLVLLDAIRDIFSPLPEDTIANVYLQLVVLALYVGALAFVTRSIAGGRNWARITLLMMTLIDIAVSAFNLSSHTDGLWRSLAVEALATSLSLLVLYWLFSRPGAAWFRQH